MEKKGKKVRVGISIYAQTMHIINKEMESGKYADRSHCVNSLICKPKQSNLDTQILHKLIPFFAKARLKVRLEPEEQNRVTELFKQ